MVKILIIIIFSFTLNAKWKEVFFKQSYNSISKENIYQYVNDKEVIGNLVYTAFEGNLFFTEDYFKYNCQIDLIKVNFQENTIDTIFIDIPFLDNLNCESNSTSVKDIYLNDKYIYISTVFHLFIFEYSKTSAKLFQIVDLDEKINRNIPYYNQRIKVFNENVYGLFDLKLNRLNHNGIFIWKYNINTKSIDTSIINEPNGYYLTNWQPKSIVDYFKDKLLYTDLTSDSIYIISKNETEIIDLNIFENRNYHNFNDINDSIYTIHRSDYLSDDIILISYSKPKILDSQLLYSFRYCLVLKENNNWEIIDGVDPFDIFGDDGINIDEKVYNMKFKVVNNYLISIHRPKYINGNNDFFRIQSLDSIIEKLKVKYN